MFLTSTNLCAIIILIIYRYLPNPAILWGECPARLDGELNGEIVE